MTGSGYFDLSAGSKSFGLSSHAGRPAMLPKSSNSGVDDAPYVADAGIALLSSLQSADIVLN